jgi:hypothetical protein
MDMKRFMVEGLVAAAVALKKQQLQNEGLMLMLQAQPLSKVTAVSSAGCS